MVMEQLNEKTLAEIVFARYTGDSPVTFTGETFQGALSPGEVIQITRRELLGGPFEPATEGEFRAAEARRNPSPEEPEVKETGSSPTPPVSNSATTVPTASEFEPKPEA